MIFWNTKNNITKDYLLSFIEINKPDIFFIAEGNDEIYGIENEKYTIIKGILKRKPKLICIFNNNSIHISLIQEYKNRFFIYKVIYNKIEFIIGALHFPSKLFFNESAQLCEAIDYVAQIVKIEKDLDNDNTIIIGDFNMNPFAIGMISANGFNSVCSKEIALKKIRKIQSINYKYFYNPAWKLYAGLSDEIYGTFYYSNPNHTDFHWNIFDQALLRSKIIEKNEIDFGIINDNKQNNIRNKGAISDHYPVFLKLEEEKNE